MLEDENIKALMFENDYLILKNLNHELEITKDGILRFKKKTLTDKETKMNHSIQDTWIDYSEKEITFSELINFYMNIGYSVSGFMNIFHNCFTIRTDNTEEIPKIASQETIKKIISNEIEPLDDMT